LRNGTWLIIDLVHDDLPLVGVIVEDQLGGKVFAKYQTLGGNAGGLALCGDVRRLLLLEDAELATPHLDGVGALAADRGGDLRICCADRAHHADRSDRGGCENNYRASHCAFRSLCEIADRTQLNRAAALASDSNYRFVRGFNEIPALDRSACDHCSIGNGCELAAEIGEIFVNAGFKQRRDAVFYRGFIYPDFLGAPGLRQSDTTLLQQDQLPDPARGAVPSTILASKTSSGILVSS
jgi:hypothetical protein